MRHLVTQKGKQFYVYAHRYEYEVQPKIGHKCSQCFFHKNKKTCSGSTVYEDFSSHCPPECHGVIFKTEQNPEYNARGGQWMRNASSLIDFEFWYPAEDQWRVTCHGQEEAGECYSAFYWGELYCRPATKNSTRI